MGTVYVTGFGPRPRIVTVAESFESSRFGSIEMPSVALRSHGADASHGRSGPTATPAWSVSVIHGLSALARHEAMPVPVFDSVMTYVSGLPAVTVTSPSVRS